MSSINTMSITPSLRLETGSINKRFRDMADVLRLQVAHLLNAIGHKLRIEPFPERLLLYCQKLVGYSEAGRRKIGRESCDGRAFAVQYRAAYAVSHVEREPVRVHLASKARILTSPSWTASTSFETRGYLARYQADYLTRYPASSMASGTDFEDIFLGLSPNAGSEPESLATENQGLTIRRTPFGCQWAGMESVRRI